MKKMIGFLFLSSLLFGLGSANAKIEKSSLLNGVKHFKQSTIRIQGDKVVYFDPYMFSGEPHDGDIIMITHTHGDHLSIPDLKKVMKSDATVFITEDGVDKLIAEGITKVIGVTPNKEYQIAGINFKTAPAYNTNKQFHPRSNNWVGYILNLNKVTYYMAGDTDLIPEMKEVKADVAFLPVGGTYTMTADEAAQAANLIKPKVVVPIHFGDVVGSIEDAKKFVSLLDKGIEGDILK